MSFNYRANPNAVPDYLKCLIKLNELQKMTEDLDEELADSQKMMQDMKALFDNIPVRQNVEPVNDAQHEALAQFLQASPPQLLMEDMTVNTAEVDLDNIIVTMKLYTEELRKNLDLTQPQSPVRERRVDDMDLGGYASSLDQLIKRLAKLKLTKPDEANNRNTELEAKLQQLCNDANSFTQMVQAMKTQGEVRTPGKFTCTDPLVYDNLINKLLADINEVTYLLKNKN